VESCTVPVDKASYKAKNRPCVDSDLELRVWKRTARNSVRVVASSPWELPVVPCSKSQTFMTQLSRLTDGGW
jgi:hypothetical protein